MKKQEKLGKSCETRVPEQVGEGGWPARDRLQMPSDKVTGGKCPMFAEGLESFG